VFGLGVLCLGACDDVSAVCCKLLNVIFASVLDKRLESAQEKSNHLLQSGRSAIGISETRGAHLNMLREWLMASKGKTDAETRDTGLSLQEAREALADCNVSLLSS
jgi:hypothetical protein